MTTCVWIVLRRRTDPWAARGEMFRNVCGAPAEIREGGKSLCERHAVLAVLAGRGADAEQTDD